VVFNAIVGVSLYCLLETSEVNNKHSLEVQHKLIDNLSSVD